MSADNLTSALHSNHHIPVSHKTIALNCTNTHTKITVTEQTTITLLCTNTLIKITRKHCTTNIYNMCTQYYLQGMVRCAVSWGRELQVCLNPTEQWGWVKGSALLLTLEGGVSREAAGSR